MHFDLLQDDAVASSGIEVVSAGETSIEAALWM